MDEDDDAILKGEVCRRCGLFLAGTPPGHPRTCEECGGTAKLLDLGGDEDDSADDLDDPDL